MVYRLLPAALLLLVVALRQAAGAQPVCIRQLLALCGGPTGGRAAGAPTCLWCCGIHQSALKVSGCSNADTHTFCEAAPRFQFGPARTAHTQPGAVHASPIILNDTVLFSTLEPDCAFYRLNATSGAVLWRFAGPHRDSADPVS